ncbi:MAG: serine acetyltransferase [Anaerolineales bacterium]|nr:serine acetyltransferase [Anaerolineales bacterium]
MFELFKQDAARWVIPQQVADSSKLTFPQILRLLYYHMPLRTMFWYRLGSWLVQKRIPLMKGFFQRALYRWGGVEISPGADIAGGLYIAHPIGSVISPERIGKNCTIIHSVTIGMRNEWAFPVIGDNVFIGAGARILGGIRIGDNAIIGANAVVIHDVPDNTTVVGIPAKAIIAKEATL